MQYKICIMTIYLDIIFLENLFMNSIILMATSLIMKKKINLVRIIISGTIGSVYTILVYMSASAIFSNIILQVMLSIVMVQIAFAPKSFKTLLKNMLFFYLTSFTFGGATFALLYFVRVQEWFNSNRSTCKGGNVNNNTFWWISRFRNYSCCI